MEFLMECLLELILEGTISASKNKKVPKPIRYLAILVIFLFFVLVISLIILSGVLFLKLSIIGGITLIILGVFIGIMSIIKFYEIYLLKLDE